MRFRNLAIIILILLGALLAWRIIATSGEYAKGTSVNKVRIGGDSRQEASQKLLSVKPRDLEIVYNKETISLPGRALWQKTKKTLDQIKKPSLWQRITGSGGDHYEIIWGYNKEDLQNAYQKALSLEKQPSDARWVWNKKWILQKEEPGLQIEKKELWNDVLLSARSGGGRVLVSGKSTKPALTAKKLRQQQPTQLLVDQSEYKLYVYRQGRLRRTYSVAVGAPGFETPNGNWTIIQRTVDPAWLPPDWAGAQAGILVPGGTPENPLVARWMGIGDGVGIHGTRDTWSLGSAASHGCIRMDPEEVKELYEIVPLGTPFRIQA